MPKISKRFLFLHLLFLLVGVVFYNFLNKLITATWWQLRVLHIHQLLLDEPSAQLYNRIESLVSQLTWGQRAVSSLTQDEKTTPGKVTPDVTEPTTSQVTQLLNNLLKSNDELNLMFHMELFHVYVTYGVMSKCNAVICTINAISRMSIELKGALGKRTQWQQKSLAQLILDVQISNESSAGTENHSPAEAQPSCTDNQVVSIDRRPVESSKTVDDGRQNEIDKVDKAKNDSEEKQRIEKSKLPYNVKLDDDTRLDTIKYEEAPNIPDLSFVQQIIVYENLLHRYRSQPKDKLKNEELTPYIDVLLSQSNHWSLRYGVLYLRSKIESDHRRTVERCMAQLEELRKSLNRNSNPDAEGPKSRLENFFSICIPYANKVESYLAHVFVSLGDIKAALSVYEKLRHWEEMIMCYNLLQLRHLSVQVINEQLQLKETPKLYCLLGDATDDLQYYEKAWQLSGERSSRAMKSLGMYYFKGKDYDRAIGYFQKSLHINSIQVDLWSRLGFAALETKQYDLCASAYNRYVTFEPESFQGWNNLAKAYLERGEKLRAYHALVEAVKISNLENWKVIENLMRVSVDVGDFESVIRNYNFILDIKPKHYDGQVLSILVRAITENIIDLHDRAARYLTSNARKLFGRLTSEILNEYELWWLYATLNRISHSADSDIEVRKTHKYITHAHKCVMRNENNVKVAAVRKEIIAICKFLYEVTKEICDREVVGDRKQVLFSCKLSLKSTLVVLEKNMVGEGIDEEEKEGVKELGKCLKQIEVMLGELK